MAVEPAALAAFIDSAGIQQHRPTSRSYIFDCPACGHEKKLYVFKHSGSYVCWWCKDLNGTKGSRPEFILAPLAGLTVREVQAQLYGDAPAPMADDLSLFVQEEEEQYLEEVPIVDAARASWEWDYFPIGEPEASRGAAYLAGRGIPLEVAQRYGVRYCPRRQSVSFPAAWGGTLYGYQDRLVVPHEWVDPDTGETVKVPKSPSMPSLDERGWRDRILMFQDRLRGSAHAVVAEGPIDSIKADLCGGNVATMGKVVSSAQLKILLRLGVRRVYGALDQDAFMETEKLIYDLKGDRVEVYDMVVAGEGDLGDMSFREVHEMFLAAKPPRPLKMYFYMS